MTIKNVNNDYVIEKQSSLRGQYKKKVITSTEFSETHRFAGSDISSSDTFGATVAIRNKKAVASAPGWDDAEVSHLGYGSAGAIYYFEKGATWSTRTETILTSSVRQNVMQIGTYEASGIDSFKYNALNVYEDRVIAGMPTYYDGSIYSGAALVWDKIPGSPSNQWDEQLLTASNKGASDKFGTAVAAYGDYVIVGAPYEDTKNTNSGMVYVFQTASSAVGWNEKAQLVPEYGAGANDEYAAYFGNCLFLTGSSPVNGTGANIRLVVGSSGKDKAVIWKKNEGDMYDWTQEAVISHPSGTTGVHFGSKVALNNNTLVIGSPLEDIGGTNNGSVSIFKSSSAGGWAFHQGLNLGSNYAGKTGAMFGLSLDIHDEYLIVSAPHYSSSESGQGISQGGLDGRAFLYKSGSSAWSKIAEYQPYDHDSAFTPTLGTGVGISDKNLIYGVKGTGPNSGSATIMESVHTTTYVDLEPIFSKGTNSVFNLRGQSSAASYKSTTK